MNRIFLTGCSVLAAAVCTAADPQVSSVTTSILAGRQVYKVDYELSGEDAIVTADFQTNTLASGAGDWVSVGGKAQRNMGGDVNRLVTIPAEGKRSFCWCPSETWEGVDCPADRIRCVVSAWTEDNPPPVMLLDLREATRVTYYPGYDYLPLDLTDRQYKGRYYVMRRICAKDIVWAEGSSVGDADRDAWGTEIPDRRSRYVKLTRDYYIGVYPVTEQHYTYALASPSLAAMRTAGRLPHASWYSAYKRVRGNTDGAKWPAFTDETFDYATSHTVDSGSNVQAFRNRTGLTRLDLPTEAQWEFACRAGQRGALYSGELYTSANIAKLGRIAPNLKEPDCEGLTGNGATVGTYLPNNFGLYDLYGNCFELTLDWYESWADIDRTVVYVNPVGKTSAGTNRSARGGWRGYDVFYVSSGARASANIEQDSDVCQYRLAMDIGTAWAPSTEAFPEAEGIASTSPVPWRAFTIPEPVATSFAASALGTASESFSSSWRDVVSSAARKFSSAVYGGLMLLLR